MFKEAHSCLRPAAELWTTAITIPRENSPNLIIQAGTFAVSGSDTGSKKLPTCTESPNNCPSYGAPGITDPLGTLTAPSQPAAGTTTSSPQGFTPGTFNGISMTGNGTYVFQPGLYYMTGSVSCSGTPTITGTGVTFYFTNNATWNCTGTVTINLTAPSSGTYSSLLFYQNPLDTTTLSLGGNSGSTFTGIVYAPSADVLFFGDSKGNNGGVVTDIVISAAVNVQGNPVVSLAGLAGLPGPLPPAFTVGKATLVE